LFIFLLYCVFFPCFLFLFLHNISWITLTFHFREGSSSHKELAFPCWFFSFRFIVSFIFSDSLYCFSLSIVYFFVLIYCVLQSFVFDSLYCFSFFPIHCSASVFSYCSTGLDIHLVCLTSWMFSPYWILLEDLRYSQAFWFFFFSFSFCDHLGPVGCLPSYISRVCSYEYELIIHACWVSVGLKRQAI